MSLLQVAGLTKRFGGLTAVEDLSFEVNPGEIVSLIGPNGAGKTTVFNMLSGLIKPDQGEIIFAGRRIRGMKPYCISRMGIGRTFQLMQPFKQMPVLDNVVAGMLFSAAFKGSIAQAESEALRLCRLVGLGPHARSTAQSLTVPDLKRLEIARALAGKPKLLLLDEVMSGLNPAETLEAMALVKRLRDEQGIAVLLIEHVMKVVMGISDRVVVVNHGQKISEGIPRDVAADRRVIEAYLGEEREEV